jgi:hypothetical protein
MPGVSINTSTCLYIVACSRESEYLNQSDRPLLDNGYDKTKYAALSR